MLGYFRYRWAFDSLVLLADLFLLTGLVAQLRGEEAELAWGLAQGLLQAVAALFAYLVVIVYIVMAVVEAGEDGQVRLRLRLKDRTWLEKLLFWTGFVSLGRSPAIIEHEARAMPELRLGFAHK